MGSLCREALAALRTTAIQDFAAGFGCHACAKTVTVLTNPVGWLKCAFHALAPVACPDSKAAEISNRASKRGRKRSQLILERFRVEFFETIDRHFAA